MIASQFRNYLLAHALSAVLVLGTVLMPLAHYGWMATSGHFDHQSADSSSSTEAAHTHASPTAVAAFPDVEQLMISCDYSVVFAKDTAVEFETEEFGSAPPLGEQIFQSHFRLDAISNPKLLPWFRGPPVA